MQSITETCNVIDYTGEFTEENYKQWKEVCDTEDYERVFDELADDGWCSYGVFMSIEDYAYQLRYRTFMNGERCGVQEEFCNVEYYWDCMKRYNRIGKRLADQILDFYAGNGVKPTLYKFVVGYYANEDHFKEECERYNGDVDQLVCEILAPLFMDMFVNERFESIIGDMKIQQEEKMLKKE